MKTDRIKHLLDYRSDQLEKHRAANQHLAIHRQSMIEQMQELQVKRKNKPSDKLTVSSHEAIVI
jgi:hypothetical protein